MSDQIIVEMDKKYSIRNGNIDGKPRVEGTGSPRQRPTPPDPSPALPGRGARDDPLGADLLRGRADARVPQAVRRGEGGGRGPRGMKNAPQKLRGAGCQPPSHLCFLDYACLTEGGSAHPRGPPGLAGAELPGPRRRRRRRRRGRCGRIALPRPPQVRLQHRPQRIAWVWRIGGETISSILSKNKPEFSK